MIDPELLVGQKVQRYEIREHLARGGMADVYLAFDASLQRSVALKVLLPAFASDATYVDRFQREARTAAGLDHPNIIQIFDVGNTADGRPYIAMQYIEGGTLKDKVGEMDGRSLPTDEALAITRHVAVALGVAHASGIVHRDVKPSNVLLKPDGTPVLVDLGIAAVQLGPKLTQTGTLIGTPHYMSPEQVGGGKLDGRSDLYSLGVLLYQLLSARRPFEADDPLVILHHHLYEEPPPLSSVKSGLSNATYQLVRTCLQKDPEKRYATAADMIRAIDRALMAEHGEATVVETDWRVPSDPYTTVNYPAAPADPFAAPAAPVERATTPVSAEDTLVRSKREDTRPIPPPPPPLPHGRKRRRWWLLALVLPVGLGLLYGAYQMWFKGVIATNGPIPTATEAAVVVAVATDTPEATGAVAEGSVEEPADEGVVVVPIPTDTPSPTPTQATPLPDVPTPTPTAPTATPTAPTATPTPDLGFERLEIGRSVDNRSIEAVRFGNGKTVVIFIGGLHAGAAPSSVALANRAINHFQLDPALVPPGITLYIVPSANPDSPRAPGELAGRLNANDVDLNRNWACRWTQDATWRGQVVPGSGGPAPFSEPETQVLLDLIQSTEAAAVVFWEARAVNGLVSPGKCGDQVIASGRLATAYGVASGYPITDFEDLTNQELNGDGTNYLDSIGVAAVSILLPSYEQVDWNTNLAGMLAVLNEYKQ